MKHIYSILLGLLITSVTFARPVITATKNGMWTSKSTWSLNRVPMDGDSVVIPRGLTVTEADLLVINELMMTIAGELKLQKGIIMLGSASEIAIASTGKIQGGNGTPSLYEYIYIGGQQVFSTATDGSISGPIVLKIGSTTPVSLPVVFIGFNGTVQGNQVVLEWSTAQESNSSHFEIEKSADGINWSGIGKVHAAGNSQTVQTYSYRDNQVLTTAYYRIRQVDLDGRFMITPVTIVKAKSAGNTITISSTASANVAYVYFPEKMNGQVQVTISTINGHAVKKQILNQPQGQSIISLPALTNGMGVVTVRDANGSILASKQILF